MYFLLSFILVFILVCWLGSQSIIRNDKKLYKNIDYDKKNILKELSHKIDKMDGFEFEEFCYRVFKGNGYKAKLTPKTNDGGKDIILKKDNQTIYVECKHYAEENKITVNLIHKLISACTIDSVKRGIFITTSSYTKSAIELKSKSKYISLDLWYKDDILNLCDKMDYNALASLI